MGEPSSDGISCSECGRSPESDEPLEDWRFLPAAVEEPHPFCPECAEREFGPAA